ncbi:MAG: hypothetical protein ACE5GJ_10245 [Gemmatimonadota bacterium]
MTPFRKWLLLTTSLATGVTGVAYWWMKNMMEPVDPWAVINHPLQPLMLKLHIIAAPLLVFAVGLIAGEHIWPHFRRSIRLGRPSGLVTMAVLAPMVLSGYLIQTATTEGVLAVLVWTHLATGGVYIVGLAAHYFAFVQRRRARMRLGGARWEATGRVGVATGESIPGD